MATSTPVVNEALVYILVISFLLFFAIVFLMVYFVVRYRRSRNPDPASISGNLPLEVLWIVLPTLIVMSMFFYGLTGFTFLRRAPEGSLSITVISRQWSWLFTYENGLQSRDLVVPVGRPVDLILTSQDVIHSFFVPAFRIKQDCVPGMKTRVWFTATQTGSNDIMCAEYCGLLHAKMLAKLIAARPEEYQKWYEGKRADIPGVTSGEEVAKAVRIMDDKGCLDCHSLDGSRKAGPTFKGLYGSRIEVMTGGVKRTITVDDEYFRTSVSEPGKDLAVGYRAIMPSQKGEITQEELVEMQEYLRGLQ